MFRHVSLYICLFDIKTRLLDMVVAFSSLAGMLEEFSTVHSPPALLLLLLLLLFFFFEVEISSRTFNSALYARISLRWLSELKRLWPNVP